MKSNLAPFLVAAGACIGVAAFSFADPTSPAPGADAAGTKEKAATEPASKDAETKAAPETKSEVAPTKEAGNAKKPSIERPSSLDALFRLVPIGKTHEGVKYPVMENGVLSALVQSERMTRTDENSLRFEEAIIDQKGGDPLTFRLQSGVYNRSSNLLMSNQPSVIESPTYRIEGDTMTYERSSGNARMTGRVRMIIFDTNQKDEQGEASPQKDVKPVEKAGGGAPAAPENPAGQGNETKGAASGEEKPASASPAK